ncbi:TrfB-related DNA-binding protein [Azospirillum sp. sgz302134]
MRGSKRRLTAEEFERAAAKLPRMTVELATVTRRVLVDGAPQKDFTTPTRSKSAVCQAVARVWNAAKDTRCAVPAGYRLVTAVLPDFQAFQVEQWAKQAKRARKLEAE